MKSLTLILLLFTSIAHAANSSEDPNEALFQAISDQNSLEILSALEGGANANGTINDWEDQKIPVVVVVPLEDDLESTRYLLQYGASVTALDVTNETAVHKLIAYCPKAEAFPERTDLTPAERVSLLTVLLKAGATYNSISTNPYACDFAPGLDSRKGYNAFQMALLAGDLNILDTFAGLPNLPVNTLVGDLSPLLLAARSAPIVAWLLQQGADPNLANSSGETPLIAAVRAGATDSVAALLGKGANPNTADSAGETPLYFAVQSPSGLALAQALIADGAMVDSTAVMSLRPLVAAAAAGNLDLAKLLVAHGASISTEGSTALAHALLAGNDTVADGLVSLGASVDGMVVADDGSNRPVVFALLSSGTASDVRIAGLKYLLNHHAILDVLYMARTPLMTVAALDWLPELDFLVTSGAKIDLASGQETALTVALENQHCDAADHLITAHVNVNLPQPGTALADAIHRKCVTDGTLKLLLSSGATVSGLDVLHDAVEESDSTALTLLMGAKADLEALRYNQTPLIHALFESWVDGVVTLVKAGANPNAMYITTPALILALQQKGDPIILSALASAPALNANQVDNLRRTPLFYVNTEDLATTLLAHGALVDFEDLNGQTPLYVAAASGVPALVNVLLKAGAKPDHADHNGYTAMQAALAAGNAQILALFCKYGSANPYCNP